MLTEKHKSSLWKDDLYFYLFTLYSYIISLLIQIYWAIKSPSTKGNNDSYPISNDVDLTTQFLDSLEAIGLRPFFMPIVNETGQNTNLLFTFCEDRNDKLFLKYASQGIQLIFQERMAFTGIQKKIVCLTTHSNYRKLFSSLYKKPHIYFPDSDSAVNLAVFSPQNFLKKYDFLCITSPPSLSTITSLKTHIKKGYENSLKGFPIAMALIRKLLEYGYTVCLHAYIFKEPRTVNTEIFKDLLCFENFTLLTDFIPQDNLAQLMNASRILLCPNIIDASPRIIPEALCCNLPVLVNKWIYGGQHYVTPETGLLFRSISDALTKAEYLLKNQDLFTHGRRHYCTNFGTINAGKQLAGIVNKKFGTNYKRLLSANAYELAEKNIEMLKTEGYL